MGFAALLCTLAVQATWNMSNGLSSLRLDTITQISGLERSMFRQNEDVKLAMQALSMKVEEQGRDLAELKSSFQKSQPAGR